MTNWEPTEYNGQPARLYPDGSIRNEKGHFLVQHPEAHTITTADAATLAQRKHERKRERIQAGALAAVREKLPDKFDGAGDDWIEAVAEAVAYKALDKLDPKQVDAARFLLKESGYSEDQAQPEQMLEGVTGLIREIARFVGSMAQDRSRADVVDAEPVSGTGLAAGGGTLARGDADSAGGV